MMGFDKFLWFMGVVEDNRDPTMNGRVRVRAFNVHPPKGEDVPTAHLPWATVLDGSYGVSQSIPREGDWVIGFFIDGVEANHPMVIGKLPGIDHSFPAGSGLPGEDGYIPPESINRFGAPAFNSYISGEDCEVGPAPAQQAFQKNGIKTAYKEGDEYIKFSEPPIITPEHNYNTRVLQSKEGQSAIVLTETEDGSGNNILITHSSGSVVQIDSQGTIFIKSFGDTYNSSEGFEFNRIDKDSHTNVGGDWTIKVENGSGRIEVQGDLDISCNNFNVEARASANINAGSAVNISGTKIGGFATQDDINFLAYKQIKMGTIGLSGNIIMKAPFGDINMVSYSSNQLTTSYSAISSMGVPDILNLFPRATTQGIDIMCPTHVNLASGAGTLPGIISGYIGLIGPDASAPLSYVPPISSLKLDLLGSATLHADTNITIQSFLNTDILAGLSASMSSLVSSRVFSAGSSSLTGAASATVFGGGTANMTGLGTATVFGGGSASLTGLGTANVFGGGLAAVTGGGTTSISGGGPTFVSGSVTLLGTGGPTASAGSPGTPGTPGIFALRPFTIPAWNQLAEKPAVITPPDVEPIRAFAGRKANNVLGMKKPITITSRSST